MWKRIDSKFLQVSYAACDAAYTACGCLASSVLEEAHIRLHPPLGELQVTKLEKSGVKKPNIFCLNTYAYTQRHFFGVWQGSGGDITRRVFTDNRLHMCLSAVMAVLLPLFVKYTVRKKLSISVMCPNPTPNPHFKSCRFSFTRWFVHQHKQ